MNITMAARIIVICASSDVDAFSLAAGYAVLKGPKRKRKQFQAATVEPSTISGEPTQIATYPDGSKIACSWNELDGVKLAEV